MKPRERIGADGERVWSVRWLSGMAYEDFRITPRIMPDGSLLFKEGAPWAIVWWVVMAIPCCFVLFALYDTRAWQLLSDPGMAAMSAATVAFSLTTFYRLGRILTRRKTLRIDLRAHTAAIVETWPHHFNVTCDLERASIRVMPLRVTGYRLSWSGHCLIVQVGDAWFVIGADHVAPEGAAACLPHELRAIGMSPVIEDDRAIETRAAK